MRAAADGCRRDADSRKIMAIASFTGGADGSSPFAGVIMDSSGNLYGTTLFGGSSDQGTVFKLDTSGNETVLHNFSGGADGAQPLGGLIMDASGNLYGTTRLGGSSTSGNCRSGCGTVFKLNASANYAETVLHAFNFTDGAIPGAGLIMNASSNLFGTTEQGGSSGCGGSGCGTVFKVDASGNETVLHSFTGTDGQFPTAGVTMDGSGNLYGTTFNGGSSGFLGTVFKITLQTPQQAIQAIINQVNSLSSQGALNSGQTGSLVTQLQNAIKMINARKIKGAIGSLQSFITEVNDLANSGVLSSSQAAALIGAANSVIAQVS
jgi:uncharacterized repeat protein (TIGR03803 family)